MKIRMLCGVAAVVVVSYPLAAQTVADDRARFRAVGLVAPGSSAASATESDSVLTGYLLRLLPFASGSGLGVATPELRLTWNSALPYTGNDGLLWAGRGLSVGASGGFTMTRAIRGASFRAAIAPAIVYSQNLPFQTFDGGSPGRSAFANPFHGEDSGASLDLPHRFGDRHLLAFDAGRSTIAVEWPAVTVGATTRSEWWGPGVRNAIVMSSNAPGIPRFYLETTRPVRTAAGALRGKLITGTLTQSLFFDPDASENRTISGILLELVPAFDSTLTFGWSRVVYVPVGPNASPFLATLSHTFDAVARWEHMQGAGPQRSDQITSIFARWIIPQRGFEAYGEWARMDLPRTATELLSAPHHTGGWTFGFSWALERDRDRHLRIHSELTYLEQSRVYPERPTPDFYAGLASPHGYTQRGQVIGAAIGPGASSQWMALDWIVPDWQAGVFVGRIRWDNDAMYRQQPPTFWDHDVSMLGGVRGGWRGPVWDYGLELTAQRRLNYLFQNGISRPNGRTVDVNNATVAIVISPR